MNHGSSTSSSGTSSIKILDGGFSTQLSRYVGERIDGDPLWTSRFLVTDPDAVYKAHLDFLRAGSDIIETNTYQASTTGFQQYLGLGVDASLELIRSAVELASSAVEFHLKQDKENGSGGIASRPLVAGSVGPYGAHLHDGSEYTGAYGSRVPGQLIKDWHRPRMRTLVEAGCELLALETIPCAPEAEVLVELLREFPNTRAWLSFSCEQEAPGARSLADGSGFAEAALGCWERAGGPGGQLVALGVNCLAPGLVEPLLQEVAAAARGIPMIVYPNSGESYSVAGGWRYEGLRPPRPAKFVGRWLELGARYVGGCCRTGARDVAEIRTEVERWSAAREAN